MGSIHSAQRVLLTSSLTPGWGGGEQLRPGCGARGEATCCLRGAQESPAWLTWRTGFLPTGAERTQKEGIVVNWREVKGRELGDSQPLSPYLIVCK